HAVDHRLALLSLVGQAVKVEPKDFDEPLAQDFDLNWLHVPVEHDLVTPWSRTCPGEIAEVTLKRGLVVSILQFRLLKRAGLIYPSQ
ncbi:MAG: hypothetical protein LBV23_03510, partial [Deltaproteobacteria bacterium]|nr:hypothetical protein [Deltaproteobacteria bacterium]